ncbi:MAG: 50S ribosomal protein L1 [Alphaproteobacteria bacterium CG11_big_fil_rev_8_21_14_0_20_44_7]|nr:MAG: 50S ribosomal protein L1 [Alphaproteobacteria bacterium CG11_big_fil_rev_8_21_14_0_20_44_7]
MAKKQKTEKSAIAAKRGKRYASISENLDADKIYALEDGLKEVKSRAKAKFDESIELALNLGLDMKDTTQIVRGVISMPNGTGKTVRVAVVADGDKAEEARKAGADFVGVDEFITKVEKGELDFDRVIATPDKMGAIGRVAKTLGPRGLMPNPKLGTVTVDVAAAVKAAKAGQVEFRAEKAGIVHAGVGKSSFDDKALAENIRALVNAVNKAKPQSAKGVYLKSAALSSTMGVGVKIDIASLVQAA